MDIIVCIDRSVCPLWWWAPTPANRLVCLNSLKWVWNSSKVNADSLSDKYFCSIILLSLQWASKLVLTAIVSCKIIDIWNSMWAYLEAWSTNIQPPLYISFGSVLPLEVINWPGVEQMKWSSEISCPGIRFPWRITPWWSLIVESRDPGDGRVHCFADWYAAHLGEFSIPHTARCSWRFASEEHLIVLIFALFEMLHAQAYSANEAALSLMMWYSCFHH